MKEFFKNNVFYSILFWLNYVFNLILILVIIITFFLFLSDVWDYYMYGAGTVFWRVIPFVLGIVLFVWLVFEWFLNYKEYKKIKNNLIQKASWKNYLKLLFYFIPNLVLIAVFILSMFGKQ